MKNTKLGDQEETIVEMLEPEAELDRQLVSSAKETRNQAIRYILWGLISVAVNFAVYYITYNVLGIEYQMANGIT